jgi:hypothetical protein
MLKISKVCTLLIDLSSNENLSTLLYRLLFATRLFKFVEYLMGLFDLNPK